MMINGKVKQWDFKGWGFISGDDGEDYFVHINNVRRGQSIRSGDKVRFDTEISDKGLVAINVFKIS